MNTTVGEQISFLDKTISKADGSRRVDALAFEFGQPRVFFLASGSIRDVD